MTKTLLLTCLGTPQVALLQEGKLHQLLLDDVHAQADDVYLAKVVRILPALNVVFLDIGEEKNAILTTTKTTKITQGQWLIVQITRPAHAHKGAIATLDVALVSPYLVYRPYDVGIRLSAKLSKDIWHTRHQLMSDYLHKFAIDAGVVVRTSASQIGEQILLNHIDYLHDIWQKITTKATTKTPQRLYRVPLPLNFLNEHANISSWLIDDEMMYQHWHAFCQWFLPTLTHIEYCRPSLFDSYKVYMQLQNALKPRVDLPSGAYLVIEVCEAMTVIDVNTGTLTHSSKDVIYQANLEAIIAIAHQLILRQIGGLVVIDLIDMENQKQKELIYQKLKEILSKDTNKVRLLPINEFGLLQLSREKRFINLYDKYTHDCPMCMGKGKTLSMQMLAFEVLAKLTTLCQTLTAKDTVILRINEAFEVFLATNADFYRISTHAPFTLQIKIMADYADDKYDILQNKSR